VLLVVLALVLTWAVWQPLRSLNATNDALAQLEKGDYQAAIHDAYLAHDRNPLSLEPLSVLAVAQAGSDDTADAEATLKREVQMQPANPDPWVRLADFQFNRLNQPKEALTSLEAAVRLDPRNPQTLGAYLVVRDAADGG
jgi:cytochrome c-type biogenesis protein CcmH/NrfG